MTLLVNFLVALVNDSNKRANEMHSDPDVLKNIRRFASKIWRKKTKDNRSYVYFNYSNSIHMFFLFKISILDVTYPL